jgi:hypothetical protein
MNHCFPSILQIVKKVIDVKVQTRGKWPKLRKICIITNRAVEWLSELKTLKVVGDNEGMGL